MKISVTQAAKEWSVSRTTLYQKINGGELSRTADKKIDSAEMLRVFGEPVSIKPIERSLNTSKSAPTVQHNTEIEHQLALEKLNNAHLRQQVIDQKQLIDNYQQQIAQLNKTLDKANASIQDFAQVRLLEFKKSKLEDEREYEQKIDNSIVATVEKKKRWWKL